MRKRKAWLRIGGGLLVLALIGTACGGDDEPRAGSTPKKTASATTKAADVRALLNSLLSQHVFLAASATGAALGGRTAQFDAAKKAVFDANATQLADAVGSVYGADARTAFLPLWQKHIGFVVDYTSNFGNKTKQDKAVADLLAYTEEFGAFIEGATEKILPKAAVASLVKDHILTLKAVIDNQAAKKPAQVFPDLLTAYAHMSAIAGGLAGAIDQQKTLDGDANAAGAKLRADLGTLLGGHVYLAALATGAALGGRQAEFDAAKKAVFDTNATQLADAVGSVYGADARTAFLPLWQKHIGFVVDYTSNFGNKTKQDKAVADLLAYTEEFGAFIEGATEKILPKAAVASLVKDHILTLKTVIDAQQKKDFVAVYPALIAAYDHMDAIAKGLASAIEQQGKI